MISFSLSNTIVVDLEENLFVFQASEQVKSTVVGAKDAVMSTLGMTEDKAGTDDGANKDTSATAAATETTARDH